MKKVILLVLGLISGAIYAQRAEDAIAIHAKAGIMKGKGEIVKDLASSVNLGLQWFVGQQGFLVEGGFFMQDFLIDYKPIGKELPYRLYGLNVMGGWSLEDLNPLFFNVKAGGFAGYYLANNGNEKEDVYNTTLVNEVTGITYGAVTSLEAEVTIWKKLTGVASFSQYFYPNDKWIKWNYAVEAGLKWYL